MEQCKTASCQIYAVVISRRNLMFLNVVSWLFVLYFSVYEDGIAAALSYVSVALTVCALRVMERNVCETAAYFLDLISRTFILAGVFLLIFSEFWNTAFYSVCLGILIQKITYDTNLQPRNLNPDLQASSVVSTTDDSDEFRQVYPQDALITENDASVLNGDKYSETASLSALTDGVLQCHPENGSIGLAGEIIPKGNQSPHKQWNKSRLDVSENSHGEIFSIQDFQRHFHEQSDKSVNMLCDQNIRSSSEISVEPEGSTLKFSESLLQSDMGPTYEDVEENIENIASLCDLKVYITDLQELALREFAKIQSNFDLDVDSIERELKENEESNIDTSEQSSTSNIETLQVECSQNYKRKLDAIDNAEQELKGNGITSIKIYEKRIALSDETLNEAKLKDIKQLDVINNTVEHLDEPENKVKELFNGRKNISCDAYSDSIRELIQNKDLINSREGTHLCQQNLNEIKQKQPETTSNCIEAETEAKNTVGREFLHLQASIESNICEDNCNYLTQKVDLTNCCSYRNSCLRNTIEHKVDLGTVHPLKNADSPLLDKRSINLDANLLNQESFIKVNCPNFAIDRERGLMEETSLEETFEIGENSGFKTKYLNFKSKNSAKTTETQPEKEKCAYLSKYVSVKELNPDVSVKKIKVLSESEDCLGAKSSIDSLKTSDFGDRSSTTTVELAINSECRNLTMESNGTSGDADETLISGVSNVKDVVNKIDLGFIYAVG